MKVAHYCIGEPYRRLGGLVSYVESMIEQQAKDPLLGQVYVIFPWFQSLLSKKCSLKIKRRNGKIVMVGIKNPNPESLLEGIRYPEKSISNPDLEDAFVNFINDNCIDIVHFHTFYCLSANLLSALKKQDVKIIFSVHDYQALCPTINLLDPAKEKCDDTQNGIKCIQCNRLALTRTKHYIRNNRMCQYIQSYNQIKSFAKKIVRSNASAYINFRQVIPNIDNANQYKLRQATYIHQINDNVDLIIYNSYLTKRIFTDFGVKCANEVIPVSHKNIKNKIEPFVVHFNPKGLKFGFMGGKRTEKGALELIDVFNSIFHENLQDFELHLFGEDSYNIHVPSGLSEKVVKHGFSRDNAYDYFDILIVPSLWCETFGFIIPEALLNKKGIIASNDIGALTFINDGAFTFKSFNELKLIIKQFLTSDISFQFSGGFDNLPFPLHYQILSKSYKTLVSKR
ncbi:glycosyl transferase family 1 [Breznakibacter xylanolyticus]|uniref:Glycosyl transferase family 1 n=1 Tax=Breznakibacter xylanolyticus TaxID=990 RepID=A0A2W7NH37_9BACT|nr:glycosyltransferase [Breznakibacter xylanolyticus]PZX19160.1 glycosyl transferase family 1 [Breznakibacter xylanolyticus]